MEYVCYWLKVEDGMSASNAFLADHFGNSYAFNIPSADGQEKTIDGVEVVVDDKDRSQFYTYVLEVPEVS